MRDILLVLLGWLLSLWSSWWLSILQDKKRNVALLTVLLREMQLALDEAIITYTEDRPFTVVNKWWQANKILYVTHLPEEALLFDDWNAFLEDGVTDLKALQQSTRFLKDTLQQSKLYWSQNACLLLFHITKRELLSLLRLK
jgi:hypothetical protein